MLALMTERQGSLQFILEYHIINMPILCKEKQQIRGTILNTNS